MDFNTEQWLPKPFFLIKQKVANLLVRLFLQNLLTCGLEIFGWLEMAGGWLCDYKPIPITDR